MVLGEKKLLKQLELVLMDSRRDIIPAVLEEVGLCKDFKVWVAAFWDTVGFALISKLERVVRI